MSYHCEYIIFDSKKLPDPQIKNRVSYELEELEEFISSGSVFSYIPEDNDYVINWLLPELAKLHDIPYEHYLNAKQIEQLLSVLDRQKVKSLLPDANKAEHDARVEMERFIQLVNDGLAAGVFDNEDINVSLYQRYAVPLFKAHGMIIYSTLSKKNAEQLIQNLNDTALQTAISKAAFLDVISKEEQRIIIDSLQNLKAIHQKLRESSDYKLLFYDDYEQEYYPKETIKQLLS